MYDQHCVGFLAAYVSWIKLNKTKLHISFLFLLVAILIGWLLRMQFVYPINGINFRNFLHGHTHVALLGWVFNAVFLSIWHAYSPIEKGLNKKYNVAFWLTQFTVFGALISFPIQGYAAVSITFSTLFLFVSYWFYGLFLKTAKDDDSIGGKLCRWGMFFLLLSSLGPCSLGAIMAKGLRETVWYPLSIYFYLHFLYNGFILYCMYGLVFKQLDKLKISYNPQKAKWFFILLNLSIFPTLALSAVWVDTGVWVNAIGLVGGLVQLIALGILISLLLEVKSNLKRSISPFVGSLFLIAFCCILLKSFMQFFSGFQSIADFAFQTKPFTIVGYIHLVMLGVITLFLIAYLIHIKAFHIRTKLSRVGILLFITGFVLSELLFFGQGAVVLFHWPMISNYHHLLFYVSGLMPIGLILFFVAQLKLRE